MTAKRPPRMDDATTRAVENLRALGVPSDVIERLRAWGKADSLTLAAQVRFVLSDYHPPTEGD